MTINTIQKHSSELALAALCEQATSQNTSNDKQASVSASLMETWNSLPSELRAALVKTELANNNSSGAGANSDASIQLERSLSLANTSNTNSSHSHSEVQLNLPETEEECPETGTKMTLRPLERAPENVFAFVKTTKSEETNIEKKSAATVTTKTTVVTTSKGWRNVFSLPISYDVNLVQQGTLLDPSNPQLLEATGVHPEGYNRRFAVIDEAIHKLFGQKIVSYFTQRKIQLHYVVLPGGEPDKRPDAVDKLLDKMCEYKLRRREPFLAIGGGCLLDIAGMAACLYRRGVPFVRVPTTLLAIVDASVGVKNGVDYYCGITDETYKNRVGSFYAPSSCLLDSAFIATQDRRNVSNGFGEILKLALVRSVDLFELLETHGAALVESRFASTPSVPKGVSDRMINLSIQIMLEELGPNLWEKKLERCVDYGHTFSKLLEMVPGADIMHGEAVNVDGFFCCILSHLRGFISKDIVDRVFKCMQSLNLPTDSPNLKSELAWQSCKDAIEHRNGAMRIPLITDLGESVCVSDVTPEELDRALEMMKEYPHKY